MKNCIVLLLAVCSLLWGETNGQAVTPGPAPFPDSVCSGTQGKLHVQGIAVDRDKGCVYWSFTDRLIKTDLSGKLIGSVTGFLGHLGDLDFDQKTGKIYGSLEYKDDAIGKGIGKALGIRTREETGFYIAVFDGPKIVRPCMDAEKEDIIQTVYLKEPVMDYMDSAVYNGQKLPHRFACSGIDGLALGPSFGSRDTTRNYLYVAYGIYGDTARTDNDCQVIVKYDIGNWGKYAQKLYQDHLHRSGPPRPLEKYFLKTGATSYGIQNLAYDSYSGNFYAAVYKGAKKRYPNYDLFVIDGHKTARDRRMSVGNRKLKVKVLSLQGHKDSSGIAGWHFKWGATGLCPLGQNQFYISHNATDANGRQYSTLHKYQWVGSLQTAFQMLR